MIFRTNTEHKPLLNEFAMFFRWSEDTRRNNERNAGEFGVEIGEYAGVILCLADRDLREPYTREPNRRCD